MIMVRMCAETGTDEAQDATAKALQAAPVSPAAAPLAPWEQHGVGAVAIAHKHPVTYITWHAKGDYFASVAPTGGP